jgi:3-hydroxy-3-methylglutaryl CoA synthase
MAVSAAENCLGGSDTNALGACFFASTSNPYAEKQAASVLVSALDMKETVRAADYAGTLRAGANALLSAFDFAAKGADAVVAVADCRISLPSAGDEAAVGDGAAAFRVGSENLLAEFAGSYSVSRDFADTWRLADEPAPRTFDTRYAMEYGYIPLVAGSIGGLLKKCGLQAQQITKVVLDATSARRASAIAKACGFEPEQMQAPIVADFGYTGCAYAPMLLVSAFEQSEPGDLILYASYGEGSDALLFRTVQSGKAGKDRGLAHFRAFQNGELSYEKYLRWKELIDPEPPRRPTPVRISVVDYYRKSKKNLGCYGSVCKDCGTPIFPPVRICAECHSVDHMEPYSFRGRPAKIATFTFDSLSYSPDPPGGIAVVDFEGGGRMFYALVDVDPKDVAVGMNVELCFRIVRNAEGVRAYAWKVTPHRQLD